MTEREIRPGDDVKVLVRGRALKTPTPGVWVANLDDDEDAGADVYVDYEELLPVSVTARDVAKADALGDFARWIVSLDDPDPDSQGHKDRKAVSLPQIIGRARVALGLPEED